MALKVIQSFPKGGNTLRNSVPLPLRHFSVPLYDALPSSSTYFNSLLISFFLHDALKQF